MGLNGGHVGFEWGLMRLNEAHMGTKWGSHVAQWRPVFFLGAVIWRIRFCWAPFWCKIVTHGYRRNPSKTQNLGFYFKPFRERTKRPKMSDFGRAESFAM